MSVLLSLFMVLYFFSEGCTEGYTWAGGDRRRNNGLIRDTMKNKEARGVLDYHGWRLLEGVGILGVAVVSYFYVGDVWNYLLILGGSYCFGNSLYEFALHYIASGSPVTGDRDFHILGVVIRVSRFYPFGAMLIGVMLLYLGFAYV